VKIKKKEKKKKLKFGADSVVEVGECSGTYWGLVALSSGIGFIITFVVGCVLYKYRGSEGMVKKKKKEGKDFSLKLNFA
jgi:hypothetical protein